MIRYQFEEEEDLEVDQDAVGSWLEMKRSSSPYSALERLVVRIYSRDHRG